MRPVNTLTSSFAFSMAAVAHAVAAVGTALERRRIVRQLVALDDYLLRDMGITRQDVESALTESGDPTRHLADRAREARAGRRSTARQQHRMAAPFTEHDQHAGSPGTRPQRAA